MADKDVILTAMTKTWQQLAALLDGVPLEEIAAEPLANGQSIKTACSALTAWDGEALRRIDFVTGHRLQPPHNPLDDDYWQAWLARQIAVKTIMAMRGILVDMVGTRQRLLARVAGMDAFHVSRWLDFDPLAVKSPWDAYLPLFAEWRAAWDAAHPPPAGLVARLGQFFGRHRPKNW